MKVKGCKFDPYDGRDWEFVAAAGDIPKAVDNRRRISSIKDQATEGSCVGFAIAKGIEVASGSDSKQFLNLSERWAYEKAKVYDEWPGNNYEGSSVRGGLKAAHKVGICTEQMWPYVANRKGKPHKDAAKDASNRKVFSYARVRGINDVKRAIHENKLVVGAALVHSGWFRPARNGVIPFNNRMNIIGGHAFTLVGYGGVGFWVANSWGTGWGKRGFGVLSYNDAALHLVDAWTVKMADAPKPEPKPKACDKCGRPL